MRELDSRRTLSRVQGRAALERSIRLLLIRCHRFARLRANTEADLRWAGKVIDQLAPLLYDRDSACARVGSTAARPRETPSEAE